MSAPDSKRLYAIHFERQILVAAADEDAALDLAERVARDVFYAVDVTPDEAAQTGLYVYLDEGRAPFPLRHVLDELKIGADEEESE